MKVKGKEGRLVRKGQDWGEKQRKEEKVYQAGKKKRNRLEEMEEK